MRSDPVRIPHALNIQMIRRLLLCCCACFLVASCRRARAPITAVPVEEVSVAASGIELRDVSTRLDASRDWPGWRGPMGDGIAVSKGAPTSWRETEGIRWMSDVPGRGHGSPIVVGELILLATAIDAEQKQMVLAYNRNSGSKAWEKIVHIGNFPSASELHPKGSNANSTLVSDGERAYVPFFNDGRVIATALDLRGEMAWQTDLGAFSSKFGYAPSPVLYKSFVIFAVDNWGGGYIVAVDSETGDIAWRISRDAKNSHSSPYIANVGGKDQLLICGCDQVASYDPATGEQYWSTPATTETTCGTMVAMSDKIYAAGGYPGKQTICLTADGKKVWDNRRGVYEPSLLAVNGELYAVNDEGIAYCWSAEDGRELWKKRLGGNFSASPAFCNGNIYVSDLGGKTYIFKASAEGYEEVDVNRLGSDCYGSPAIAGGEIFLRVGFGTGDARQEKLVAIGEPKSPE